MSCHSITFVLLPRTRKRHAFRLEVSYHDINRNRNLKSSYGTRMQLDGSGSLGVNLEPRAWTRNEARFLVEAPQFRP